MDDISPAKAALLGAIDGLSEFLPVSSAAHVAVAAAFLGLAGERLRTFECALQIGAVMAVIVVCLKRFGFTRINGPQRPGATRLSIQLAIGLLPTALTGLFARRMLQGYFFNGPVMAMLLFAGGAAMLLAEARYRTPGRVQTLDNLKESDAFKVGVLQCVGVIVSGIGRPEAAIIGGLFLGMSRQAATEFGILLSIPTLLLASVIGLIDGADLPIVNALPLLIAGAACSFVCAWASVEWLLRFVVATGFDRSARDWPGGRAPPPPARRCAR